MGGHIKHSCPFIGSSVLELCGATVVAGISPVVPETQKGLEDLLFRSLHIPIQSPSSCTCKDGAFSTDYSNSKATKERSASQLKTIFLTVFKREAGSFLPYTLSYRPEAEGSELVGVPRMLNIILLWGHRNLCIGMFLRCTYVISTSGQRSCEYFYIQEKSCRTIGSPILFQQKLLVDSLKIVKTWFFSPEMHSC